MPSLIGNKPNQVPTNGDLGRLAFMDNLDSFTSKTVMDTDITNIAPSLNLDFANSKVLDPRITFTRASTATFYNGISSAVAEQNLLLNSQSPSFISGAQSGLTLTANTTVAPDGTTTGTTAAFAATTSYGYQSPTVPAILGTTYTFSVWVWTTTSKATISVRIANAANGSDGTLSSVSLTTTPTRIAVTRTFTSAGTMIDCGFDNRPSVGGDGIAGSIVYWGAQLEQRSAVTAYTPTTTAAVTNYIPTLSTAAAGVARFDHNPITGESLGLLIEEQRANLLTYSDDFSNAAWTKTATTITANTIIAPDGSLTGDKINETTANSVHQVTANNTLGNATYTLSAYLKAGERNTAFIRMSDNATGDAGININLTTGALTPSTLSVGSWTSISSTSNAVGNGWYRVSVTATKGAGASVISGVSLGTNTTAYVGVENNGIYIWGAQLEAGSFATSYIPTVASQVTRSPDAASMTGTNFSSWFNEAQGSFYSAGNRLSINGGNNPLFNVQNASRNFDLILGNTNTNFRYNSNLVIGSGITGGKFSMSYNANTYVANASVNGSATSSSTATSAPVSSTSFNIGYSAALLNYFNGHILKLSYYPRVLPNSELVEMTA